MCKSWCGSYDLQKFNTQIWKKLKKKEKLELLQCVENKFAAIQDSRNPRIIKTKYFRNKDDGRYDPSDSRHIYIDSKLLCSWRRGLQYDALYSVIHEGWHAFQDDCTHLWDMIGKEIEYEQIKVWGINFHYAAYIRPKTNYIAYRYQPIENSANNYAVQKLMKWEDYFSHDFYYKKFINNYLINKKNDEKYLISEFGENYLKEIEKIVLLKYKNRLKTR